MSDVIDSDGFRANVGIVLMRGEGEVFLGRRTGGRGWQFPQGGVRAGEQLEEAALRELHEEIGVSRIDVELVGRTTRWLRYRLPPRYIRRNQRPVCIGQKQRWFLLRLKRADVEFDFGKTNEPEFDQWR
jgi:putative (di)nucleoside polyphosphate hydrolase